jgi:dolichyl-phosphate beta-glucosyltransferase
VIPAYNEESRLPSTLQSILSFMDRRESMRFWEILVVDDGSRDGTAEVAARCFPDRKEIRVLRNPGNRGKGYSVRHGILEARGEWVLFTDADLSVPIEDFDRLSAAVDNRQAEIAIGSRGIDRSLIGVHQPKLREYSGRLFNVIMRAVVGLRFHDTQCGFKLYRAEAAKAIYAPQRMNGFSFDVEHLAVAKARGIGIVEVPVRWNNVEGTKVSALAGLKSFLDLIRIRWNQLSGKYSNRMKSK